jgi:hypothetical protein
MHAAALPNIAREGTVCDTLTVPEQLPAVHGFGDSVRMVVPAATPAPDIICPATRRPDATGFTESERTLMLAVTEPMEL